MKRQRKRIISAWLLLSIFVSIMMLSTLHRHHPIADPATYCEACTHHVHHSGHFTTAYEHLDDCVLCQFISLTFVAAAVAAVAVIFNVLLILYVPKQYAIYSTTRGCIVTRGPPAE